VLELTWSEPSAGALAVWLPATSQWVGDYIRLKRTQVTLITGTGAAGGSWEPLTAMGLYRGIPFDWSWKDVEQARQTLTGQVGR
jgi:hypothetical protein